MRDLRYASVLAPAPASGHRAAPGASAPALGRIAPAPASPMTAPAQAKLPSAPPSTGASPPGSSPGASGDPALLEQLSPGLLAELGRYLTLHRDEVAALIRRGGDDAGLPASALWTRALDGLLSSLFHAAAAALTRGGAVRDVTLAAVGSYGRGTLSPGSDLDVRLLVRRDGGQASRLAEALLYPLWDSGMAVGHQVVTSDELIELARTDLPTATTLLDWRTLAGPDEPAARLLARAAEGLFGPSVIKPFLDGLEARTAERRERYGGSVYLLEPDVKNGPGGLRDLDVCHWAARARWSVKGLADLTRIGVAVPREWQPVADATRFLTRVRNVLHLGAGRRSDRLAFDRQEQLAVTLGYGEGGPAVERFMSEYYRHARAVLRFQESLLARAAPPPRRRPSEQRIDHGLKLTNGAVSFMHSSQLDATPAVALRLFDEAVRRDAPVSAYARDAVMRACSLPAFCERLRQSEEAARLFVRLCTVAARPRFKAGSVMQELHDVGLLVAMVPEFSPVVGRVHHDIYHVLTVDAHSVAAVDRLAALRRGELAAEFALASRLAAEVARPSVMVFAALLHDVGKDIGGRQHSERGAELGRTILTRLRLPEAEIVEVCHLIAKHLRMYHVATRRDLDDPATITAFADEVRGREGLRELYLLTVVDVGTTSPAALNEWKVAMLDELYAATDTHLASDGTGEERRSAEVLRTAARGALGRPSPWAEQFLAGMPERYLYTNGPEQVAHHAALAEEAAGRPALVRLIPQPGGLVEAVFTALDRPGLLSLFTATLAAARLGVLTAQIHSWADAKGVRRAFDLFLVGVPGERVDLVALEQRLQSDLSRLVQGALSAADLMVARRGSGRLVERPVPRTPTEVHVDNRASSRHTVIELTTQDRPGLLHAVASALQAAGLDVALAKINTEGSAVADVFYVSDANGAKVVDPARIEGIRAGLLQALRDIEGESR